MYSACSRISIAMIHMVGGKKNSHLPSVQWDRQYRAVPVPFPFNYCVRSCRSCPFSNRFRFVLRAAPSVQVNGLDGGIKRVQSLIAQEDSGSSVIVTELERELPSMVVEQQKGSRQFSDRDRARARAT